MKITAKQGVVGIVALGAALLLFAFAGRAYPVPAGDSVFFITPALELATHGTLTNMLFIDKTEMNNLIDPTGQNRFLFYPPLFPLALRALMFAPTPQAAFLAIALMNTLVVIFSALLFYKTAAENGKISWGMVCIIALALLALMAGLDIDNGRPELLARVWVVLAALVPFYAKRYDWLWYGLLLGLMGATHTIGAVALFLIIGTVYAAKHRTKEALKRLVFVAGLGAMLAALIVTLGPFSLADTIHGIFAHAGAVRGSVTSAVGTAFTVHNLVHFYLFSAMTPFYGLVILLMLGTGWFFYRTYRDRIKSRTLFIICTALLALVLAQIIYTVGHVFYISLFAPLIFAAFIAFFARTKRLGKWLTIAVLALVSLGIVRTALLFPFMFQQPTLAEARMHFAEAAKALKEGEKIGVTGGLWTLSENYEKMYMYNDWPEPPAEDTALVFFQERYSGLVMPPLIPGCRLETDKFSQDVPHLFGIKLANTMPGYGYAVYTCQEL